MVIDMRKYPSFESFVDWLCEVANEDTLEKLVGLAEQTCQAIETDPKVTPEYAKEDREYFSFHWRRLHSLREFIAVSKDDK